MHSATHLPHALFNSIHAPKMQALLAAGNTSMLLGCVCLILCIVASYPFAHLLPLSAQVGAHIATLLFATVIKLGYISRCVALNALPKEKKREL